MKQPEPPISFLQEFKSSEYAFLKLISNSVNNTVLKDIASANIFNKQANECYYLLKNIRDKNTLPHSIDGIEFAYWEILNLTRWAAPPVTSAFTCILLLLSSTRYETMIIDEDEENTTLAILLNSISEMEIVYSKSLQEFIIWRILINEKVKIDEFFIYTLLLLMIKNNEKETKVERILNWLIASDTYCRDYEYSFNNNTFLLGLTVFKSRHNLWKKLTKKMLKQINYITNETLKKRLQEIANCIINDKEYKELLIE